MKTSRYNWLVEHEGNTIAYNGLTGAMAILDESNVPAISNLINANGNVDALLKEMDDSVVSGLKHGGYVIENDLDERKLMSVSYNLNKFCKGSIYDGYTIVMTRRCNFRCKYCFESDILDGGDSITETVIDKFINIATVSDSKHFSITLYGGEPLLEFEKCVDLTRRCREATELRGAEFGCGMITNGYLLTRDRALELRDAGVSKIQITLDGSESTHNANRPHANGSGTYKRIVENIKSCTGIFDTHIRMNITEVNVGEMNQLKEEFAGLEKTQVHFEAVDLSCKGDSTNFDRVKSDIASVTPADQMRLRSVNLNVGGCNANNLEPRVLLPNGNLVRCWEHLEDEESSCSIFDDPIQDDMVSISRWVSWNPYMPGTNCYECRYLPGCGGGCPRNHVYNWKEKCVYLSDDEYIKSIIGTYIQLAKRSSEEQQQKEMQ